MISHESQLFGDTSMTDTDPARVTVPSYLPDTQLVRQDFARHYDNLAKMDAGVGEILAKLEEDGVAENTIVFFFADNGRGFPRDKRTVFDGGIHEPLIVRWPGAIEPGTVDPRLVSYLDLPATTLALAGVPVPDHMQGRVFLGPDADPEPEFVFAAADRHDEATDRIRAVRDRRFKYLRNYQPETPYGLPIPFRDNLATMQEIYRLHDEGTLAPPADWFYVATKPLEELYDTEADPDEVVNLAGRPEYADVLARMRTAHEEWVAETGDLGAIPEAELAERYWPGGVQPRTPAPSIAPPGGRFAGPVTVTLAASEPGAGIAYTLEEGDDPHWRLYTGPLSIEATATLRVRAVRYGWAESEEVEARFQIAP